MQHAAVEVMPNSKTRRAHGLQVTDDELGSWSQACNKSPLIGIVLLLALAPDGHLASQIAAACLMQEGSETLSRSSIWQGLPKLCALGHARNGHIETSLKNSRRGIPTVVRTSRWNGNCAASDEFCAYFAASFTFLLRLKFRHCPPEVCRADSSNWVYLCFFNNATR